MSTVPEHLAMLREHWEMRHTRKWEVLSIIFCQTHLGELERLNTEADARIARLNEWMAEIQMNAFKWMQAHDKLMEGKPYDLPKPADLPNALAEADALREALTRAVAAINALTNVCEAPAGERFVKISVSRDDWGEAIAALREGHAALKQEPKDARP